MQRLRTRLIEGAVRKEGVGRSLAMRIAWVPAGGFVAFGPQSGLACRRRRVEWWRLGCDGSVFLGVRVDAFPELDVPLAALPDAVAKSIGR